MIQPDLSHRSGQLQVEWPDLPDDEESIITLILVSRHEHSSFTPGIYDFTFTGGQFLLFPDLLKIEKTWFH